jgi:uncharacterized protein YdeI (YjbR/CyaY-like superfamily)
MEPAFFPTAEDFRRWLDENHATAPELLVGFWKVGSGKPSITWNQSVDEALSFGWIDGVRRSLGDEAYTIRFTPRRPGSVWSAKNIQRFGELKAEGRIRPAGEAAFADPKARTRQYAYERPLAELSADELVAFQQNERAWTGFSALPPSYRKVALNWVVSAKKPETRARRLKILIEDSAQGRKIGPMRTGRDEA